MIKEEDQLILKKYLQVQHLSSIIINEKVIALISFMTFKFIKFIIYKKIKIKKII